MKNKRTWKGCWKESEPTVSFRHFANDGTMWFVVLLLQSAVVEGKGVTNRCPVSSNCPTKRSKKCWHVGLFSWLCFMKLLYSPVVIL